MSVILVPILISPAGVKRCVYVDTETLAVKPFTREIAGVTTFNGVGVLASSGLGLPSAIRSSDVGRLAHLVEDDTPPSPGAGSLTLIPFC